MNWWRIPALALCLVLCGGARDPILVPEISQHEIQVRQGFTGADLLLFGAILTPEGNRAAGDYDIVVLLEGPARAITAPTVAGITPLNSGRPRAPCTMSSPLCAA